MALMKEIELDNGVILNYHRIVSINKITNNQNIIEIASYTNETKRQEEIDYYNSTEEDKKINVYIDTTYINKDYNENETIEDVYEYLKTTDKFKDAENI
jgi:hypothetical protein